MRLLLERITDNKVQTIGHLYVLDSSEMTEWDCHTIELPWKDNERRVSCIPEGKYRVEKHFSPRFKKCFWVKNVEGRSEILIHAGNTKNDTLGCILPGVDLKDINGDKHIDVTSSKTAINKLLGLLPDSFEIEIINGYDITHG